MENKEADSLEKEREANTCIGLGLGVGALGATAAAVSGAVCPLCIVIAPALVGFGLVRRIISKGGKNGTNKVRKF
jgi:hypothetical protein